MVLRDGRRPPLGSSRTRAPFDPRAILTSIGEVVYDWDIASDAISWGLNAAEVFGAQELSTLSSGRDLALATEPDVGQTRHDAIFAAKEKDQGTGVAYRTRYCLRLGDGQLLGVEDTGRWFAEATGQPVFAHGVVRVERGRGKSDGVSAEPIGSARDRMVFLEQVKHDVAEARHGKRPLTLLVLAIEELGNLNEEIGCEAADAVIREVATRLQGVLRRRDRLARYSGNRFAIALAHCSKDQAEVAAKRLAEAVEREPIATKAGPALARLRIGGACVPDHAVDPAALLHGAEEALAGARRETGRSFALYNPAAQRGSRRRVQGTPATDVLEALNGGRVTFARQPVVEGMSRLTAFSEALVRVRDGAGRLLCAGDVLPTAERSGLVPFIDARMLQLTADYLQAHPEERLSINVSPVTLDGADWLGTFAAHLGARPGIASRLIVEITETAAVRDAQAMRIRLDAMKALGVAIAIDDFGAGHTSFKHLRSFPVDILKIDGAFIQNLRRSPDDQFFVRTLVDLAHHLDILTVAEWVGDEETATMLTGWGVDYLQGDYCGEPVVVDESDGVAETKAAV